MTAPYIQNLYADRIGGRSFGKSTEIYKFEKIKRAKRAARKAHPETPLIDMGVGEPDEMAFPEVVQSLQEAAADPSNRGYADNGSDSFKQAAARYMHNVFGVEGLQPETEIVHSIGSKAALSILPNCFINPGDVAIMTTPGYPIFGTHTRYLGGSVYHLPLTPENHFLPDLDSIPTQIRKKAKVLVLNYPNNPTGASATLGFFEKAVDFAKDNGMIIVQDAAYSSLIFEGTPVSILQVEGAKEVCVELHSLSKSFNMTGWRIGFTVGCPGIISAYAMVKDNSDSGQFLAIQKAAETALNNPWITERISAKYSRRMDQLVKVLNHCGFQATKPKGSFFLYVRTPKRAIGHQGTETFETAEAFSQWLIHNLLISTVPWDDAGAFVRFSVTFDAQGEENERRVLQELGTRFGQYSFEF
ncbi:MAG: LL-diaminopimelate aminotransferase [Verrucomicrobia bacterium ADurb.Bin474]|nr:MAG: LL-diaminopimelate aminotransferase [Verrucomicrobia bacterium ADurb.Bin474]